VLKDYFDISRPPRVLSVDLFNVHGPVHLNDSFPSGHTLSAWMFVSILFVSLQTKWKWGMVFIALLVGLSRIALGVHWPMDVIAGMTLGWAIGLLACGLVEKWPSFSGVVAQRIYGIILFAVILALFWYESGYSEVYWMQRILAVIGLISMLPVIRDIYFMRGNARS